MTPPDAAQARAAELRAHIAALLADARRGELVRERVEDEVDGAHEVQLHDGPPGRAVGCPGLGRECELEVWRVGLGAVCVREGRGHVLLRVVDLPERGEV